MEESGESRAEPAKVDEEGGPGWKEPEGEEDRRRVSLDPPSIYGGLAALQLDRVFFFLLHSTSLLDKLKSKIKILLSCTWSPTAGTRTRTPTEPETPGSTYPCSYTRSYPDPTPRPRTDHAVTRLSEEERKERKSSEWETRARLYTSGAWHLCNLVQPPLMSLTHRRRASTTSSPNTSWLYSCHSATTTATPTPAIYPTPLLPPFPSPVSSVSLSHASSHSSVSPPLLFPLPHA